MEKGSDVEGQKELKERKEIYIDITYRKYRLW